MTVVDTHAVVWMTQDRTRLSLAASLALQQGLSQGRLAIADITLRELAQQISNGRFTVNASLSVYLRFVETHFEVIPISGEIAERSAGFGSRYPRDPADRLIGATAVVHGGVLVTRDEAIRNSGEVTCVW